MSKYRVKLGMHMIGEKFVRAGDIFELDSDTFIATSGRPDLFELAPPPEVVAPDDENDSGDENDEPRVVSTGREPPAPPAPDAPPAPVVPVVPAKRGRKPKQAPKTTPPVTE